MDNLTENKSKEHCHYVVPRKKRRCRMTIKPGHFYCGEHSHLLNKSDQSNVVTEDDRIPCPLDPKHSCSAKRLQSHLKKCPSKQGDLPDFISPQINVPKETEDFKGLTVSNSSDQDLLKMIGKINDIYEKEINSLIKKEILKHPLVEDKIVQEHIGAAASKHLVQNSSLLQHLSQTGALEEPNASVIEFGSGRGQLTYWVAKASKNEAKQKFLLVDKASHRHKFDNKLKDEESELSVSRIRADIQDLVLEKIPEVKTSKAPVIGVSKHLCGAATDLALRCMENFAQNAPERTKTILIALCCHHRCDWKNYVGKDFLRSHNFKAEEFSLLCGLTSWATCGTGRPRESSNNKKTKLSSTQEDNPHTDRYERLELPREKREEIGRRAKRILDQGRCKFIKDRLHMQRVKLCYYVDLNYTLENVVLIAEK